MLYLGLDSSTQGVKAIIIDDHRIVAEERVNFGKDLPEYYSPSGFLENDNPEICHTDPLLWLAAPDMTLTMADHIKAPRPGISASEANLESIKQMCGVKK